MNERNKQTKNKIKLQWKKKEIPLEDKRKPGKRRDEWNPERMKIEENNDFF